MNKQGKNGIGWTDYTFNPIKGMCPVNCKLPDGREYCYARKMYQRFGWNPEIRIAEEYPDMVFMPFCDYPKRIFIGSTFELFHPSVKKEWRDWIFDVIEYNDRHTFQILTKFPENLGRRHFSENAWIGTSIENVKSLKRGARLERRRRILYKFISFEPLLERIPAYCLNDIGGQYTSIRWIIIGRLTGHGKRYDPPKEWIQEIVKWGRDHGVSVFLKNNLREIWGGDLIQEFPE